MDLFVATSMFDNQPVYDKYTDTLLFMGQPLNYDGSVRDSIASWRQSISAVEIVLPDRGVVYFGSGTFLTGRVVQDFSQGEVIRENVILHPCDDSYRQSPAVNFLTVPIPAEIDPFYGGATWRKSFSDERESPELHNICDIYFSSTENHPTPDNLMLSASGIMYRVMSVENREGGFLVAVCSELGLDSVVDASYIKKGEYNSFTDSIADGVSIDIKAIIELVKTNFKFVVADTAKYEPGDRIVTVRVADVADPKPEDSITILSIIYRIVSARFDEGGTCWELHCRRA